jgi:hypothetical protein
MRNISRQLLKCRFHSCQEEHQNILLLQHKPCCSRDHHFVHLTTPLAHAGSTPGSGDSTTDMDSLDCSPISASSVLMGSPSEPPGCYLRTRFPVVVPTCLASLVLRTWTVLTRSEIHICMSRPHCNLLLLMRQPHLQAGMINIPFRVFHTVQLWFRERVMMRFILWPSAFLSSLYALSLKGTPFVRSCPAPRVPAGLGP